MVVEHQLGTLQTVHLNRFTRCKLELQRHEKRMAGQFPLDTILGVHDGQSWVALGKIAGKVFEHRIIAFFLAMISYIGVFGAKQPAILYLELEHIVV